MTTPTPKPGFEGFVAEMRRRHVVRFALGYAAAAFVVLQLAEIVFPAFGYGEGALRVLVIVCALGFPPATVLAWIFDITSDGIQRTEGQSDPLMPRLALLAVTVLTMTALGTWLAGVGVLSTDGNAQAAAARPIQTGPLELVAYDADAPISSVAVLPLDDFSPDDTQAYFTAGLHEELISKLGMLDGVRVASRRSVARYAGTEESISQIGRELGVDVVVEGSISRPENRVRITLRVVHAASEYPIQTLQFEREIDDALAIQAEVADALAHQFDTDHDESVFTQVAMQDVDPAAQQAYLRGRAEADRGTPDGYRMALDYFEEAVETDPDFVPARSGLAGTRFLISLDDPETAESGMGEALREARVAFQMDSSSMEAREVLSTIEQHLPRPNEMVVIAAPEAAEAPSVFLDMSAFDSAMVSATTALGRRIEEGVRVRTFSDRGELFRTTLEARQLMSSGDFPEAVSVLKDVLEENPNVAPVWQMLARSHASAGDAGSAVEVVIDWHQSGAEGAPDDEAVAHLNEAIADWGEQGYWTWSFDQMEAAQARGDRVPPTELAAAAAGAGKVDAALLHLTRAVEMRDPGLRTLRSDPVWDSLRSDERFRAIMRSARDIRPRGPDRTRPPR